jgi:hypothetical protein
MIFSVALDFVVNYGKERRQSGAKEIEKWSWCTRPGVGFKLGLNEFTRGKRSFKFILDFEGKFAYMWH